MKARHGKIARSNRSAELHSAVSPNCIRQSVKFQTAVGRPARRKPTIFSQLSVFICVHLRLERNIL